MNAQKSIYPTEERRQPPTDTSPSSPVLELLFYKDHGVWLLDRRSLNDFHTPVPKKSSHTLRTLVIAAGMVILPAILSMRMVYPRVPNRQDRYLLSITKACYRWNGFYRVAPVMLSGERI